MKSKKILKKKPQQPRLAGPEPLSPAWWLDSSRYIIKHYLRLWGFLSLWLAVPLFFGFVAITSRQAPQVYVTEPNFAASAEKTLNFKVALKGAVAGASPQLIFLKGLNSQSGLSFTFDRLLVSQDPADPEVFRGSIKVDQSALGGDYTFWIKGPVHLERRFDKVALSPEGLDFTAKALLAGDLILPETGPDNKLTQLDQDYLWSLLARGGSYTPEEIKAADLDLDGKITGRDQSLLIDTGVGVEGEK